MENVLDWYRNARAEQRKRSDERAGRKRLIERTTFVGAYPQWLAFYPALSTLKPGEFHPPRVPHRRMSPKPQSLTRYRRESVARKRAKADAPRLAKLQAQKAAEKKAIQKRAAKRIARSEARKGRTKKATSGVLLMPVVGAM